MTLLSTHIVSLPALDVGMDYTTASYGILAPYLSSIEGRASIICGRTPERVATIAWYVIRTNPSATARRYAGQSILESSDPVRSLEYLMDIAFDPSFPRYRRIIYQLLNEMLDYTVSLNALTVRHTKAMLIKYAENPENRIRTRILQNNIENWLDIALPQTEYYSDGEGFYQLPCSEKLLAWLDLLKCSRIGALLVGTRLLKKALVSPEYKEFVQRCVEVLRDRPSEIKSLARAIATTVQVHSSNRVQVTESFTQGRIEALTYHNKHQISTMISDMRFISSIPQQQLILLIVISIIDAANNQVSLLEREAFGNAIIEVLKELAGDQVATDMHIDDDQIPVSIVVPLSNVPVNVSRLEPSAIKIA